MSFVATAIIGTAALNYLGGRAAARDLKQGGIKAREVAYANAADLRRLAAENANAYRQAGNINAAAVLNIAQANALRIERSAERNMFMYALQSGEEKRRHLYQIKTLSGEIRARTGPTGIRTNTGTPLHKLYHETKLGIQEQRWGDLKAYWTIRTIWEEAADQAEVVRLTGEQQAEAIIANAEINARMSQADAERQATALERSGELALVGAQAQASAASWQGVTAAASTLVSGFGAGGFGGSQTAATVGVGNYLSMGSAWTNNQGFHLAGSTSWGLGGVTGGPGFMTGPIGSIY